MESSKTAFTNLSAEARKQQQQEDKDKEEFMTERRVRVRLNPHGPKEYSLHDLVRYEGPYLLLSVTFTGMRSTLHPKWGFTFHLEKEKEEGSTATCEVNYPIRIVGRMAKISPTMPLPCTGLTPRSRIVLNAEAGCNPPDSVEIDFLTCPNSLSDGMTACGEEKEREEKEREKEEKEKEEKEKEEKEEKTRTDAMDLQYRVTLTKGQEHLIQEMEKLDFVTRIEFKGMRSPLEPGWGFGMVAKRHNDLLPVCPSSPAIRRFVPDGTALGMTCFDALPTVVLSEVAKRNPPTHVEIAGGRYTGDQRMALARMEREREEQEKEKQQEKEEQQEKQQEKPVVNEAFQGAILDLCKDPSAKAVELVVDLPLTKGNEADITEFGLPDYIFRIEFKGMQLPLDPNWHFSVVGLPESHRMFVEDRANPAIRSGVNSTGVLCIYRKLHVVFSEAAKKNLPTSVTLHCGLLCSAWRELYGDLEQHGHRLYPRMPWDRHANTFPHELALAHERLMLLPECGTVEFTATSPVHIEHHCLVGLPEGLDFVHSIELLGMREPLDPGWACGFQTPDAEQYLHPAPECPALLVAHNFNAIVLAGGRNLCLSLNEEAVKNPPFAIRVRGGLFKPKLRKAFADTFKHHPNTTLVISRKS